MREGAALFERHSPPDDRTQKKNVEQGVSNSLVDTAPHPWYDEGGFNQSYAMDGFRGARIISSAAEGRLPGMRRERESAESRAWSRHAGLGRRSKRSATVRGLPPAGALTCLAGAMRASASRRTAGKFAWGDFCITN